MQKKAQMDISFSWIFAIIVGIIIIIGAVYGLTQFTRSQQSIETIEGAKEIEALLGPLEIGFEEGEFSAISMPVETRIYTSCRLDGDMGRQGISLSEKFKGVWSERSVETSFRNKYLFLDRVIEGKNFYLFSKSFEFPFPAGSLIFMTSSKKAYCFIDAPDRIIDELNKSKQTNIFFDDCPEISTEICFENPSCEIYVNENNNYVEKRGNKSYFEGDTLMYAAIFSEKQFYDCQVKRVMQRVNLLVDIYSQKNIQNSRNGCLTDSNYELLAIQNFAESLESSEDFIGINHRIDELQNKNNYADCKLW